MTLIETGYDDSRKGTRKRQLEQLQVVQKEFPEVSTAPILATASLGQRYDGQPSTWQDTYTRAIEVDPKRPGGFGYVVYADVDDDGDAGVDDSNVQDGYASRRQVGLEA